MQQTDFVSLGLSFKLIGHCQFYHGDTEIKVKAKKSRLLLALLALSDESQLDRLRVAKLVWSRHADEQALNSLRQALAGLKRDFGDEFDRFFTIDRNSLGVNKALIDFDYIQLDSTFSEALPVIRRLTAKLPLDDLNFKEEFIQEWILQARLKLIHKAVQALQKALFGAGSEMGQENTSSFQLLLQQLLEQKQKVEVEISQLKFTGAPNQAPHRDRQRNKHSGCQTTLHQTDRADSITSFLSVDNKAEERLWRYCCFLADKGRNFWIDGFLTYNFSRFDAIKLNLLASEEHSAVPYQHLRVPSLLKEGSFSSEELLDEYLFHQGKVLLLGNPGSGKTTLMLRIMEKLLQHFVLHQHGAPVF